MAWMKAFAAVVTAAALTCAWRVRNEMPRRVPVGEHLLRVQQAGTGGDVTVVFEIGMGGPLEMWGAVQPRVAQFARTVAYDRLGSRHAGTLTGRNVAAEVHAMLEAAGARPPYVLVGQSFGGIYCRLFADAYPDEVAGLVLVDPTQERFVEWLRRERPELAKFSNQELQTWPEAAGVDDTLEQINATATRPPSVPVTVITGTARGEAERDQLMDRWWGEHEAYAKALPLGRHVAAEHSGHGVQSDEPELVAEEVRRVVEAARPR